MSAAFALKCSIHHVHVFDFRNDNVLLENEIFQKSCLTNCDKLLNCVIFKMGVPIYNGRPVFLLGKMMPLFYLRC